MVTLEDREPGVYAITSPSGNFYIGSSNNMRTRTRHHRSSLMRGDHNNTSLQSAYHKYNGDLVCTVLAACSVSELISTEQRFIDAMSPKYNQSLVAGRIEQNEEMRRKKSEKLKGRPKTEKEKRTLSEAAKGRKHSDEARAKMSASRMGMQRSPEAREKTAAAHRGKIVSEETRVKLSAAAMEYWHPSRKFQMEMPL
ncbi:GIY-YIG nuclease family protein [Rhizobium rhizogenes]|uniref:GIY-YIG nuclease family protein n=1 Tax=Rhizobium rhizogenes TaxID=359 RepID=UPI0009BEF81D|nr:GIY-YIG nuclease family protein [Rhizobium rhizogenes]NTJ22265.1 GIY-YIG nuclease family protein [Rhizobium rhizogenes]QUE80983.1 GIY-YIG nuclease family protein [Rhizobium rhizogenes]TQO80912.1 hypothetical protein FFE80_07395 [Rhizobium rhizogenes]TRB51506.1 hypothetical protein EXN69_26280 [Rhizobium rhizogenes]